MDALTRSRSVALGPGPVLVGMAGPEAGGLVRVASALARGLGRGLAVCHAASHPMAPDEAMRRLGLASAHGLAVHVGFGEPAAQVLAFARDTACALVVLGLPEARAPVGPVVERLLVEAPCPVALVPGALPAGWSGRRRILLPLDGTPSTAAAAPLACEVADRLGAALDVLHVASEPGEPGSMSVPRFMDEPYEEWAAWREEFLRRFVGEPAEAPCEAHLLVESGAPGEAILRAARDRGADFIVVGWHGRIDGGHARVLRALLASSDRPLLTARLVGTGREGGRP